MDRHIDPTVSGISGINDCENKSRSLRSQATQSVGSVPVFLELLTWHGECKNVGLAFVLLKPLHIVLALQRFVDNIFIGYGRPLSLYHKECTINKRPGRVEDIMIR